MKARGEGRGGFSKKFRMVEDSLLFNNDNETKLMLITGSRPSNHYFRSVCLSVSLLVCAEFFAAVFDRNRSN